MSIPDQGDKETYSRSEVDHIVARRIAQEQIKQLTTDHNGFKSEATKLFTEIKTSLDHINVSLSNSSHDLYKCRDELKKEIHSDFVSKELFNVEMEKVEGMIRGQWKTITVAVAVCVVMINVGFKFFGA